MISKDKLIEFLKSANIEYEETNWKENYYVAIGQGVEFTFDKDGNYKYLFVDSY